jgi:transcriptional regulator with XRE-family HTH domain
MPTDKPKLKEWYLKEWREYRGFTQPAFARHLGVYKGDVSNWESQERGLSVPMLQKLAEGLNLPNPGYLMFAPDEVTEFWENWNGLGADEREELKGYSRFRSELRINKRSSTG